MWDSSKLAIESTLGAGGKHLPYAPFIPRSLLAVADVLAAELVKDSISSAML